MLSGVYAGIFVFGGRSSFYYILTVGFIDAIFCDIEVIR